MILADHLGRFESSHVDFLADSSLRGGYAFREITVARASHRSISQFQPMLA